MNRARNVARMYDQIRRPQRTAYARRLELGLRRTRLTAEHKALPAMTREELRDAAKAHGLTGYGRMLKPALVEALSAQIGEELAA